MAANTFGHLWRLSTFGESHGPALGGMVDGCPAGIALDAVCLQAELDKRKPGADGLAGLAGTARKESDTVQLLSGVFEGYTTGTPIGFIIANEDQRSRDYGPLARAYRPGHADCTYDAKYGRRDYRGGGRSSGRETAVRVAGGAIAQAFLATLGVRIFAATVELGGLAVPAIDMLGAQTLPYFSAHKDTVPAWDALIGDVRGAGDTVGGIVRIEARHVPAGLGEPVFDKLDAMLAAALMSVGAVKGVEVGAGFAAARARGSANNDAITGVNPLRFDSNAAGGILGGISSGQDIVLRVAVKPIPSIAQGQHSVDATGQPLTLRVGGRHDICAIPRIVPVLSAMTALVLADAVLLQRRMGRD
ncbi:MAG: chorismate synthase [Desulfovibrionaceae bacterium]